MRGFGRDQSPSLGKMDLNTGRLSGQRFSIGNIVGDPFWLGTIGIGISGWLIAFIGSILADTEKTSSTFPNYPWWALVYLFLCICGVIFVAGTDSIPIYHVALSSFLAAGMVLTTSAVNSLIYESQGSKEAAAAGYILLSIVCIIWVFYFGSQPQAVHRQTLDSFALRKDLGQSRTSRTMQQSYRPETMHSSNQPPQNYTSSNLAGFETSSPVTGYSTAGHGFQAQQGINSALPSTQTTYDWNRVTGNPVVAGAANAEAEEEEIKYPYRAKAIYSYESNPADKTELSFNKNDVLEVSDVSGRWWQARIPGTDKVGIAPSNYLILL